MSNMYLQNKTRFDTVHPQLYLSSLIRNARVICLKCSYDNRHFSAYSPIHIITDNCVFLNIPQASLIVTPPFDFL